VVEKVYNISGSSAGAGSAEFDLYRAARDRERARVEAMEIADKLEQEKKALEERVARNKAEADARTKKNAEKRKKKKAKQMAAKLKYQNSNKSEVNKDENNNDNSNDSDESDGDSDAEHQDKKAKNE
jgi:hypothetical protein